MNRTRHLSDHELLFNGADYDGDTLTPTKDQIEEIWHEHQASGSIEEYKIPVSDTVATRNIGRQVLVLQDPIREELKKTPEDLEREAANRLALQDKIHDITEPYVGLFTIKIPRPRSNKRTVLRKRLKTDTTAAEPWEAYKLMGNFDATLKTTLYYKPGEDHNTLEKASVRIKRRGNGDSDDTDGASRGTDPVIEINYSPQDEISSLAATGLYDGNAYRAAFGEASEPQNAVGEFVEAVVPRMKGTGYGYDMSIELTGTPTAKVSARTVYTGTGVKLSPVCEYRYEPSIDAFKLYASDTFERPKIMSVDDYMELVQDTLSVIPVTESEY